MAPKLARLWWHGAAAFIVVFIFVGWRVSLEPAGSEMRQNNKPVVRLQLKSFEDENDSLPASLGVTEETKSEEVLAASPTPTPSTTTSTTPSPSTASTVLSSSSPLTLTRQQVLARVPPLPVHREVDDPALPGTRRWPSKVSTVYINSDYNLEQLWGATQSSTLLPCSAFNPKCDGLTTYALLERYHQLYQPPRFYPSLASALELYRTKKNLLKALVLAFEHDEYSEVAMLRRGYNVQPPSVAVVYNGWVTAAGSVLSDDVFIPMWPDSPNLTEFRKSAFPSGQDQAGGEWKKVKEVVVISHIHQGMFWHLMTSEYFRIFSLLPYLQANPDIYVHLGWAYPNPLIDLLYSFLNISSERLLWNVKVQADVVYYTQHIDRNDVPSLGMTYLISEHLLDALQVPPGQRVSVLAPPSGEESKASPAAPLVLANDVTERSGLLEVNLLFIVRKDNAYKGRVISNYNDVKQSLLTLFADYPNHLRAWQEENGVRAQNAIKINYLEHHATMGAIEGLELFSRADIVIGPHGAGFINLFAVRPGAHVIELITARHLNVYTSARLGLAYHGCVANSTREGIDERTGPGVFNFVADVEQITRIVRAILDSRFA